MWSGSRLRLMGFLLMFAGLMVASLSFVGDGEGVVLIFPFIYGVEGWAGILLSLLFMGVFMASSLMPWYLMSRKGLQVKPVEMEPDSDEAVDYLITLDVPQGLNKTIYVDGGEDDSVVLRSSADPGFYRVYNLPKDFLVDEYTYEYEENYLVLRLRLVRSL